MHRRLVEPLPEPAVYLVPADRDDLLPRPHQEEAGAVTKEGETAPSDDTVWNGGADVLSDLVEPKDRGRSFEAHAGDSGLLEHESELAADETGDVAAIRQILKIRQSRGRGNPGRRIILARPLNPLI